MSLENFPSGITNFALAVYSNNSLRDEREQAVSENTDRLGKSCAADASMGPMA